MAGLQSRTPQRLPVYAVLPLLPAREPAATDQHFDHKAGDKLFIDFAGKRLSLVDQETGEVRPVEFFVAVLGCSQLTYAQVMATQRKEDFITALQNALHYFGGVPTAIVPDNLKAAVTRPDRYEPQINETLADFALHY